MLLRNRLVLLLCSIAVTGLLLQGCGVTGPTVKRKKIKKMDKVAVVSVSVNGAVQAGEDVSYTAPANDISIAWLLPPREVVKSALKSRVEAGASTTKELLREVYNLSVELAKKDTTDVDRKDLPSRKEFNRWMGEDVKKSLSSADKATDETLERGVDLVYDFLRTLWKRANEVETEKVDIAAEEETRSYPDFQTSVQTMHSWLFEDVPQRMPFSLVEEAKILGNSKYQNYRPTEGKLAGLAERNRNATNFAPGNYNIISDPRVMKDSKIKELINLLPAETDGMLTLASSYRITDIEIVGKSTKEKIEENRNANPRTARVGPNPETGEEVRGRIRATTSMIILDRKGNIVFRTQENADSDSTFTYVHGKGQFGEDADRAMLQATRKVLGKLENVY